jgi:predicted nucleotidyltransferase
MTELNEALREAIDRLVQQFEPERIILFGSQARGTADSRSDVDLLVVCTFEGPRRKAMVAMDRALAGLPFARDIVVVTPEEYQSWSQIPGSIVQPARREGRVVYDRQAA